MNTKVNNAELGINESRNLRTESTPLLSIIHAMARSRNICTDTLTIKAYS